jgi:hypothetical protein
MVEQQVEPEILAAHFEAVLPANEGKSDAHFEQKVAQMAKQPFLQVPLLGFFAKSQEVKSCRGL